MIQPRQGPALVTGATGFVGSHLALRLLRSGRVPRLLVREPKRLHPDLLATADVVRGDLLDPGSLQRAVAGCVSVFHCAANVATWDRWEPYRATNVDGVRNLVQALRQQQASGALPARLVHLSTVDVYGYPAQGADESSPCNGGAFGYGRSKAQGEALLRELASAIGLSWCVLRPTNVMGPRSPFIQRIGAELRNGLMLLVDGGRADCGFLHVDNLVDCMLWAESAAQAHHGVFNMRDPIGVSWRRFVQDLRTGIGGRGHVLNLPYALAEAGAQVLQAGHRLLQLPGEPLLHPLLVRMFGRDCAHPVQRALVAGAPLGAVSYEQAMQSSIDWFLQQEGQR